MQKDPVDTSSINERLAFDVLKIVFIGSSSRVGRGDGCLNSFLPSLGTSLLLVGLPSLRLTRLFATLRPTEQLR
jgi:hypothetical protein